MRVSTEEQDAPSWKAVPGGADVRVAKCQIFYMEQMSVSQIFDPSLFPETVFSKTIFSKTIFLSDPGVPGPIYGSACLSLADYTFVQT